MLRNIIKILFIIILIFLIYFFDSKIFWIFGGISLSDVLITFISIFSIISIILVIIMKKKFENSLFKNFVYSKEYIIVLFIILLSLPFIKYLNSSCSDLSEEQQCVCWDITNFQLDGKNPEIKGKFIDACSKFRDIKLNSE